VAGFRITSCFHVGVGMNSDPLSQNPNRIMIRWLFLLGIIMTLVNGFSGFFFARKHGGSPHDIQLLMGILIPHIALGFAAWNSKSKVACWIRLSLWIASNAFLFLPVATKTLDYFTRWMAGRFNAADVGSFAAASYFGAVATSMSLVAIVFFSLWPLAEIIIAAIHTGRTDPKSEEPLTKNGIQSLGLSTIAFSVFQFLFGFAILAFALGIQIDFDHMPGLLWSLPFRPMFTVACSHFMIGFAILSRARSGWIAIVVNALAWCIVAISKFT
jgi:hypothetical protein